MSLSYQEVFQRWADYFMSKKKDDKEEEEEAETVPPDQVLPFLYIGDMRQAHNHEVLRKLNITNVLNCAKDDGGILGTKCKMSGFNYMVVDALDSPAYPMQAHFEDANTFIEEARLKGEKVLVHCQAGMSRSATVVLSYLMWHSEWTLRQAHGVLVASRPVVLPNEGFFEQLLRYERQLFSL